jgi:hypothetical protein
MSFNFENYFSELSDGKPIIYHKGKIDSDLINRILDTVEEILIQKNESPRLRKKVYNVLVESLQNLYHHCGQVPGDFDDNPPEKYGMLTINKVKKGYSIITGNFISSVDVKELEDKIKKINGSNHEEITELYKFILNFQRISPKGGGGLGLVDIVRKTGNKINYVFKEYDASNSFLYLKILVSETPEIN